MKTIKSCGIVVNINISCQCEPTKHIIYIGQSICFVVRIRNHIRSYVNKTKLPLYRAMNKYGFSAFNFHIIDYATSIEELNEKEIFYIKKYKSFNKKYGYNIALGGKNSKQTKEWVKKRIPSRNSIEAKKYGKPKTKEEKKYLSENSPKFWLGKERSEETKEKIRKTKLLNGDGQKNKELFGMTNILFLFLNKYL